MFCPFPFRRSAATCVSPIIHDRTLIHMRRSKSVDFAHSPSTTPATKGALAARHLKKELVWLMPMNAISRPTTPAYASWVSVQPFDSTPVPASVAMRSVVLGAGSAQAKQRALPPLSRAGEPQWSTEWLSLHEQVRQMRKALSASESENRRFEQEALATKQAAAAAQQQAEEELARERQALQRLEMQLAELRSRAELEKLERKRLSAQEACTVAELLEVDLCLAEIHARRLEEERLKVKQGILKGVTTARGRAAADTASREIEAAKACEAEARSQLAARDEELQTSLEREVACEERLTALAAHLKELEDVRALSPADYYHRAPPHVHRPSTAMSTPPRAARVCTANTYLLSAMWRAPIVFRALFCWSPMSVSMPKRVRAVLSCRSRVELRNGWS